MTTTHHPETPTLTPALFADLLDPSKSPFDVCHAHNLALDQLHAVIFGQHFRACVAMLDEIHAARIAAQRPQRERLALDALDRIANQTPATNTHAETVRRAAAALLRHKPTTPIEQSPKSQPNAQPDAQPDAQTSTHTTAPSGAAPDQASHAHPEPSPSSTRHEASDLPSMDTHTPPGCPTHPSAGTPEHEAAIPRSAA